MSSRDSARTRAAASSIASGIPSRRLQISSTVPEFALGDNEIRSHPARAIGE